VLAFAAWVVEGGISGPGSPSENASSHTVDCGHIPTTGAASGLLAINPSGNPR